MICMDTWACHWGWGAAQGTEESQEFGSNYRFVGLHSGEGITSEESDRGREGRKSGD